VFSTGCMIRRRRVGNAHNGMTQGALHCIYWSLARWDRSMCAASDEGLYHINEAKGAAQSSISSHGSIYNACDDAPRKTYDTRTPYPCEFDLLTRVIDH
jgi:hypothetical protein